MRPTPDRAPRARISTRNVAVAAATAAGFGILASPALAYTSGSSTWVNTYTPNPHGAVSEYQAAKVRHLKWEHAQGSYTHAASFQDPDNNANDKLVRKPRWHDGVHPGPQSTEWD